MIIALFLLIPLLYLLLGIVLYVVRLNQAKQNLATFSVSDIPEEDKRFIIGKHPTQIIAFVLNIIALITVATLLVTNLFAFSREIGGAIWFYASFFMVLLIPILAIADGIIIFSKKYVMLEYYGLNTLKNATKFLWIQKVVMNVLFLLSASLLIWDIVAVIMANSR